VLNEMLEDRRVGTLGKRLIVHDTSNPPGRSSQVQYYNPSVVPSQRFALVQLSIKFFRFRLRYTPGLQV
jgi:hypothetical protein